MAQSPTSLALLNFLLVTNMVKKLDHYIYCFLKRVHRDFAETKYMSFLINDVELLEKYNEIWEKISNSIKK